MQSIQVPPDVKKGRNQLAATVVLAHAIKHIYGAGLQAILLPEIKIGLGLSATQLGTLAFSRQVTGWVTIFGAGYLSDRFANRASLILSTSLIMLGVSYFAVGSASSYWMMFVAMLLVGIGPSLFHPPAISTLSRRFPDRRGFAISLHGTGGSAGEVLGPLVAAGMLALLVWQDVLRASLFPALVAALLIWVFMRNVSGEVPGPTSTRAYFTSLLSLMKNKIFLFLIVVTALRSMGQMAILTFLPVYLREDLEFSAAKVAVYLSLSHVMGIASQPVMGLLSDRFGPKLVLVPSMATLGFLFFALRYADSGFQLILVVVALEVFLYSLQAIFMAAALNVAGGRMQSTVVSVMYGGSFLGIVSPILAGVIADAYGVANSFLYAGAVTLLAPGTGGDIARGCGRCQRSEPGAGDFPG